MAFGLLAEYLNGQTIHAYEYFGAHFINKDGVDGVIFRLYAPMAEDVSVTGEFNSWDATKNKMTKIDMCGCWEVFIPGLTNYQCYKYHFKNAKGVYVDKADPFAFYSELRPQTSSRLFDYRDFPWMDGDWLKSRDRNYDKPLNIYECHLGSWKGKIGDRYPSYEEIADYLIPYLQEHGYTHIECMPLTQYPFDGSWGYQATGFYSVDSRYGNPKQLMSFIDRMHRAGFGVILDFAPVHFAKDEWALREFDGTNMFEYSNPRYTFSQWGSAQFDLGKDPVRSFLMSAMNYFITVFHFDGIRVDAVSNIIYWDGNKELGENTGATEFIRRLNGKIHIEHPDVMMIAEDSSDYPGVTKETKEHGLGFDYKWDLGWMNDTLKYYAMDPVYKKWHHDKITFSMAYFFNERFLLPLSHDEVVHGKGTLLNKMYGLYEDRFHLVRNLLAFFYAHPGKKLSFMGNELASYDEWDENKSLPWVLLTYPKHDAVKRMVRDLNLIYKAEPAMWKWEYNIWNFHWTMVDNNEQSVFAFEREVEGSDLLFVFNMTPSYYEDYDVGCMHDGEYVEIFNSDKDVYGGRNQYNGLPLKTKKYSSENRPNHISIKIGSYAAMIFKRTICESAVSKTVAKKPATKKKASSKKTK
ncbi:MAG: 1,4-alpha-glucan branching protein GlgB [Bacilli bacterium]|nr:1,4-alpha-glucan branching protein GlgB [Bacilli bacterium]